MTTVSQAMRDAVRPIGIDMAKVQVIPMGVDLQNLFIPPEDRKLSKSILFVGRVVEKKGLRFLIEAMPEILEKHPDAAIACCRRRAGVKRHKKYGPKPWGRPVAFNFWVP